MTIDFLVVHLIRKVRERARRICNGENYKGFIWLNEKVKDGKYTIDRIDERNAYVHDEIMPVSWYALKPSTILKIYRHIKQNEIYINKKGAGGYVKQKPYELTE